MSESLGLYATCGYKPNLTLAMELLTKIHSNILPVDTDPATLKTERRDMRKSGFRPSTVRLLLQATAHWLRIKLTQVRMVFMSHLMSHGLAPAMLIHFPG